MKKNNVSLLVLTFIATLLTLPAAQAQEPKDKVRSTIKIGGTLEANPKTEPEAPKLKRLEQSKQDIALEEGEINELLKKPKNDCELEELLLRQKDLEFLKNNSAQITEIIGKVRRGLRVQSGILKGFEKGEAKGEVVVNTQTPDGTTIRSAVIEFNDIDENSKAIVRTIPVTSLMQYIAKFEAEAKKVKDEPAAIEAFLKKYRDPSNATKAEYFYLTLAQAVKAYAGCVTGCLGSVFKVSYAEEQGRELFVGAGKDLFRVRTTTTMGWSPTYNTRVGTQLRKDVQDQSKMNLSIAQGFTESFAAAKEDDYWSILRKQQLTIDGIPVDGLLRRIYFDSKRRPECQKGNSYTFNEESEPGPFMSYKDKTICKKVGMDIQTASMTLTAHYNGSAKRGEIFNLTDGFKAAANGQNSVSSGNGFHSMVASQGVGSCDDVNLNIVYRCACERFDRTINKTYKLGHTISFGCD